MNNLTQIISFISPQYGTAGTDINYFKIAENLSSKGHKINLLVIGDEWIDKTKSKNIKLIYILNKNTFQLLKSKYIHWKITMVLAILFSVLPLFVYVYKNKKSSYLLGLLPIFPLIIFLFLRLKNNIVFSIQGLPRSNIFRLNLFLSKFICNIKYVIPNESMKNYLSSKYDIAKTLHYDVIPNAVLDQKLIRQSNEKINDVWFSDKKLKKIIAVGRLTYQKNFEMLINAFGEVYNLDSNTRLVIIGEGEDLRSLEKLASKLKLNDVVKFMGYKTNPYKYIKNSDMFVMCSRWEGPGHVLIEAMGIGCPVITTDCHSGPSDTICNGKYGLLVCSEKTYKLSEAMIYALNNKNEMLSKVNKAKSFLNRFYAEEVANKYLQLFSSK